MLKRFNFKWLKIILIGTLIISTTFPLLNEIKVFATENTLHSQGDIIITKFSNNEIWGEFKTSEKRENIVAVLTLPNGMKKHYNSPFINSTTGIFKFLFPEQPNGTEVEIFGITVGEGRYNLTAVKSVKLNNNVVRAPEAPLVYPVFTDSREVNGYARPRSSVTLKIGDQINQVIVNESGNFTFKVDHLNPYEPIILSSLDGNGASTEKLINIQTEESIIPLEVTSINERSSDFTINTLPNTFIVIWKNNELFKTITPSENTSGERFVGDLALDHDDEVLVQAYDEQGSYSKPVIQKVKDVKDPYILNLQQVTDDDGKVAILSEPDVKIQIIKSDTLVAEGMTNELGMFFYTFKEKPVGEYRMISSDVSGNNSVIILNVKDVTVPDPPVITSRIFKETAEIVGTAEPNSTVEMHKNGQHYKTAYVDNNGDFSFKSYEWNEHDFIQFYTIDQNRNKSMSLEHFIHISPVPSQPVVSDFTNASLKLIGTTEPGAKVTCYKAGIKIGETMTDSSGKFEMHGIYEKEGTDLILVATYLGKSSLQTNIKVRDAIAPSIPIVQDITDRDNIVTGTTEGNVNVYIMFNEQVIGEGKSLADGTFSIPIPIQKAKTIISVVAVDPAGNKSIPQNKMILDKTAPSLLTINPVSDQSIIIEGTTEPYAIVRIGKAGTTGADIVADAQGNFRYSMVKQPANTVFELTVRDVAGNLSNIYRVNVLDKTAPLLSKINPVSDLSTTVTGIVEPYAIVRVKGKDGKIYEGRATGTGNFSVLIGKQTVGTVLEITARDAANNTSGVQKIIVVDKSAPGTPTISSITNLTNIVTGKAESGSKITIRSGSKIIATVTTNSASTYKANIPLQRAGTVLTITATDKSNNVSKALTISVKDVIPPSIPTVNKVTYKTTFVTGKAEPKSLVLVKIGSTQIGYGYANVYGSFSVKIMPRKTGTYLSITAIDASKNVSKARVIKVVSR